MDSFSMRTSLEQIGPIDEICLIIREVADPERIVILGYIENIASSESALNNKINFLRTISHYNLLVLLAEENKMNDLQDKIENNCRKLVPVTSLIMTVNQFNDLSRRNNLFAQKVYSSAVHIYDAKRVSIQMPSLADKPEDQLIESQAFATAAKGFLASAQLHILRKEFKLAAFMLHQAFEQSCLSQIKRHFGIKINTHNLDKLYRYIRCFTMDLVCLFPRNNEEEDRLFKLLKDAYIDTRYAIDYKISERDLLTLFNRLSRF